MSLLIRNARVVPGDGSPTIPCADVLIKGDRIDQIDPESAAARRGVPPQILQGAQEIDAAGRVLMPGFVDAHTHALWAGERIGEFELKQRGATYLEILKSGGGILSTVRAVRAASQEQLAENLRSRLDVMLREGTTTVEVKSGYGLSTGDELKMLRAIAAAAKGWPGTVVPTALIGHAIDPDVPDFVDRTINQTLPAVHEEFPGITIDAFLEQGAWSLADCKRLFEQAKSLDHPLRIHADQFNRLGGLDLAIDLGMRSIDHLEASTVEDLQKLARSDTFGVMLPACGFHVDGRYANGRALLDAGGKLAIASNCNPGSAPTSSMPFVIALAVRKLGLTFPEAIVASTSQPARLLGFTDRGMVAPGKRADLILLRHRDERQLGFDVGGNPVDLVICGGRPWTLKTRESEC